MTILHYTIGLPPTRHGGSVQYAADLMAEQARQGHRVIALTCGDTLVRGFRTRIKRAGKWGDVDTFRLTNPTTPTLIYGVREPEGQMRSVSIDGEGIGRFIGDNQVEVMHIHTFMGLPRRVVELIKSLGVRIVYTTHDFYGVCAHYNFIDFEGKLCREITPERCACCNAREPKDFTLRLAGSSLYHRVKALGLVRRKPQIAAKPAPAERATANVAPDMSTVDRYARLIDYYREYFKLVDLFHFNSAQTRRIFERSLGALPGVVLPVLTDAIKDLRRPLSVNPEMVKFGFVGSPTEYKGFPMLKRTLMRLYGEGHRNFRLYAWCGVPEGADAECPLIVYRPPYGRSEISKISYHLDGMIVPSKWYETFSLVTLESLAHGRPTIVSDHVGAADIVGKFAPDLIFKTEDELYGLLKSILADSSRLEQISRSICSGRWPFTMPLHTADIINLYHN